MLKSDAGTTKVKINLKKRKAYGDEKFVDYVSKVARRAARAAIKLTEGTNGDESDDDGNTDNDEPDEHKAISSSDNGIED